MSFFEGLKGTKIGKEIPKSLKYFLDGLKSMYIKKYKDASSKFIKAKKIDPINPILYFMLAQCYDELQQYSSAIREYLNTRKILLIKSNQEHQCYGITTTIFQTNMALGICYAENKDFRNAIIYLKEALKSTKKLKEITYAKETLQLTYLKCGDNFFKYAKENEETHGYENICKYYNEAIKYYNKSISINKNHIQSYEKKAYAYFQLQNFFGAKKCLEKTISLLPKNAKQNRILLLEKLKTIKNILKTQSSKKGFDNKGENNFKIK